MVKHIIPFSGDFPLSTAILHDHKYSMEISGQLGMNPKTKQLEEGVEAQTKRVMETIQGILAQVGWDMNNIIKARIFLTDMADYPKMNEVYKSFFSEDLPTRFALAVKALPAGALVEIDCTAAGDSYTQE